MQRTIDLFQNRREMEMERKKMTHPEVEVTKLILTKFCQLASQNRGSYSEFGFIRRFLYYRF
jgi:hypothetical protein